ncbi:kinase-like domain-containing protein [Neurospora crassa]|nr:kinase-like domain-containing protein [Neurospora crassa]
MSQPESSAQQLPTVPSEITPEWLGSKLGHKIKSIKHTRSIWGTGSKLFYTITYEDDNDNDNHPSRPTHICIKGVFDSTMLASQPWTLSLAQREADFFSLLAPDLLLADTTPINFPQTYWASTSPHQGISIMTDLTSSGCTFPPELGSYPLSTVLEGIDQLAALHARYWGQSQLNHPWISNTYDTAMKFLCSPSTFNEAVRDPDRFKLPAYLMNGKRFHMALDRYFSTRNPKFQTLLHGDTHMGNIFFSPSSSPSMSPSMSPSPSPAPSPSLSPKRQGKIGFLDWSALHFGSCFHDVVYFVTAMMTVQDRRAHEYEILDQYLETLHQRGGPRFDRRKDEEVMNEYKRSFMTGAIWLVCPFDLQSKERVGELCERAVAGFGDHGVLELVLGEAPHDKEGSCVVL